MTRELSSERAGPYRVPRALPSSLLAPVLALLLGCATASPHPPDSPPEVSLPIPPPVAAPSVASTAASAAEGPSCVPATPEDDDEPFIDCAPLLLGAVQRTERQLREQLPVKAPDKLVIDYACDQAVGALDFVDLELGSGHGGGLRLVRFELDEDRVDVRSLEILPYIACRAPLLRHAQVPLAKLEAALTLARVALVARPHRVEIRERLTVEALSSSGWGSSNDFHRRLDIVDVDGHRTGGAFTGYEGSDADTRYVPMLLATEPVAALLDPLTWREVAPTAEDRAWFTERFLATMAGRPGWWVAERYLELAADYADADALPALRRVLGTCDRPDDTSRHRQRRAAEGAILAIEAR